MNRKFGLILIGLVVIAMITYVIYRDSETPSVDEDGVRALNKSVQLPDCAIGVTYTINTGSGNVCECPDGYAFDTIASGTGPCPNEGESDCPSSDVRCVAM